MVLIGPPESLPGELVTVAAGVATAALVTCAFRVDPPLRITPTMRLLAWGAMAAFSLLTVKAVLFLPALFVLGLAAGPAPRPGGRRLPDLLYPGLLAAWGAGLLLGWWRDPQAATAGLADLLRPLLGARWPGNGLWLLLVSAALAVWRPGFLARLPERTTPWRAGALVAGRLVFLLFFLDLLVLGLVVLAGSDHHPFLGWALLWAGLPFLAVGALLGALTAGRRGRWLWLVAVVAALLAAGFGPRHGGRIWSQGGGLESCLEVMGPTDLLLVDTADVSRYHYHLPVDRAGRGNILTYRGDADLRHLLERIGPASSRRRVLVLHPVTRQKDWLETWPGAGSTPPRLGKAPHWRVLKIFRPDRLPRPLLLYGEGTWHSACSTVTGMHPDGIWTGPILEVTFAVQDAGAEYLDLILRGWRPENAPALRPGLRIQLDGRELDITRWEKTFIRSALGAGHLAEGTHTLRLTTPVFVPAETAKGSTDTRRLGLDLERILLH